MAPKKPNPMEEPPAASSSEEGDSADEAEASSAEEGEEGDEAEVEGASSDDDDEEEEDEEPANLKTPPPASKQTKKSGTTAAVAATLSASEESGSESESESEPDATPKPIATKPMEETPKFTKSRSKPAAKRPIEAMDNDKDSKRAKKKGPGATEEDSKKPGEDTNKKVLFQRLWSEEDEIVVLKGLIEYSTKKGMDPIHDMSGFHDSIKNSLHVDVTKAQLADKIRRLRKKYVNNLGKGKKKGEDRTFTKPHEKKAYDLSKKIWGSEGTSGIIESAAKSNGKARKNQAQKGNAKPVASDPPPPSKPETVDAGKAEKIVNDIEKDFNLKNCSAAKEEKPLHGKAYGIAGLEEYVVSNGLDMIGGSKKAELEERWNKLRIAELELFLQRHDLVKEQATLMLEAMKSSQK